ncbi:hypothetical protein ACFFRR_005040 [Megaselia abdita]
MEVYQGKPTLENLCRSCLKILSNEEHQNISSPDLINKTKFFFPNPDEELRERFPKFVCQDCFDKMTEFYIFYESCQESTRKCLEMLNTNIVKYEMEIVKQELQDESVGFSDRSFNLELSDCEEDDHESENGDHDFDPEDPLDPDAEEELDMKPKAQKKTKSSSGEVFSCDKCDKRFFKEFRYRAHMRVHEGLKGYECPKCQKTFAKASTQAAHIRDVHEEPGANHQCSYPGCDKVYSRLQTLKWHQKSVHEKGGEPAENKTHPLIICEECGKTFKNMNSLKKHRYKHTGEQLPFECEECHKRYITKHKLKEHMMRHAGIKNFVCPYCNMRKTTRHELKTHINYHTKEKQYSCNFCNYIGNSSGNLSRHVRIVHEGIKEYACRFCDRKFGKAETCKHHEMTHTGEKPHECGVCGKRFIQAVALKTHMKTHNKTNKRVELLTIENPYPTENNIESNMQ